MSTLEQSGERWFRRLRKCLLLDAATAVHPVDEVGNGAAGLGLAVA